MAGSETTKPAGGGKFDLDEDLFNFPVIELTPEGLRDSAALAAAAEAEAAAKKAAEAAAKAAATAAAAPLPSKDKAPAASGATQLLNVTPASTPPKGLVAGKEAREAAAVATSTTVVEAPSSRWKIVLAALAALFVVNGVALFFVYRTHASFGTGIEDLRTEIGDATHRLDRAREDLRDRSALPTGTGPYAVEDAIDAIERQALALAETEIETGDYGTARRRLYRLLAQADHMPPGLRAEIEPQASYLIAKSYYVEGQRRAEVLR